jgi:O-antigen/teichoic acid export membrane protein
MILARLVPKAELGTYQQLGLLYSFTSPLLLGGVPAALLYFLPRARDDTERARWVFHAYVVLSGLGLTFAVGAVALRHPIADVMGNPRLVDALPLYAPFLFASFISAAGPNALVATGRAKLAAIVAVPAAVIGLGSLATAAALRPEATTLAIAMSASAAATAILMTTVVVRRVGVRGENPLRSARGRRLLGYGLPLALTGLAGMLGFQFDRLVVSTAFDPAVYAVYALGAVEFPLAVLVQQALNSVLVPSLSERFGRGDVAGAAALWREAIRKTSLIMLPMFVFLMVVADDLIRVLYGPRYDQSAEVFRIYLLLMPLRVATYGLIPQATGNTRINLWAGVVLLAGNAAVALALVGPLGILGPALAAPVASLIVAGYYLMRIRRLVSLSLRELFPWRTLGANFGVAVLAATPVAALAVLVDLPAGTSLAVSLPLFGFVCLAGLRLTGRLTDADWRRLRGAASALRPRRPSFA